MKFEYRETRGFCRLCETSTHGKVVVINRRLHGKMVAIILCQQCVKHLHAYINSAEAEA